MNTYHKICTQCKISKPIAEFHKDKYKKDGYCPKCKSCHKKYYQDNKESNNTRSQQYYQDNREDIVERRKKHYQDNREDMLKRQKEYYENNKETILTHQKTYHANRRKTDPLFKLRHNISSLIYMSIKKGGFTKRSKTYKILGCSFDEFKIHIESQFSEGMSWDNHGEWHFDHKTPVSWGKTEEEIIALNNYINFQPLWAEDNIRKGNRFSG